MSDPIEDELRTRIDHLERSLRANADQCQRLEIALDETRRDLRALRHLVRTGQTPEQAMAALTPTCSLCRGDGCQSPTCRGRA